MNVDLAVCTENLAKSFRQKEAVRCCTMQVKKHSIYGFLGPNGAGKTTVFKMLTGLLIPSGGSATVLGQDIGIAREELKRKIGSIIETPVFYEHLSGVDNLEIHLSYMGMPFHNIEDTLEMVGLSANNKQRVAEYSLGMRQRLGIARAIVHRPELLILDEPVNGLDPMGIRDMRELFMGLVQTQGVTVLLSSHILSEVLQMADTVGVITQGRMVKEVPLANLHQQTPEQLEEYFINLMKGDAQIA